MNHDQYFTPPVLAEAVVSGVTLRRVERIADFAAGHGDLLAAAHSKWPEAKILAADIDPACVKALRRANKRWSLSRCNFLDGNSRLASQKLRSEMARCDVILLNPPFTGKGNASFLVSTESVSFRCSRAMAFVVSSLPYLRPRGQIIAILPASCISSVKDQLARNYCETVCTIHHLKSFSRGAFSECAANTVIVRFCKRLKSLQTIAPSRLRSRRRGLTAIRAGLVRGCLPVFRAENGCAGSDFPFIHSTDIEGRYIHDAQRRVGCGHRLVKGPAVFISRVGNPISKKCAVYEGGEVVLSDCVIAITCKSKHDALEVQRRCLDNWDGFSKYYCGTCARYLTLDRLNEFLRYHAVAVN